MDDGCVRCAGGRGESGAVSGRADLAGLNNHRSCGRWCLGWGAVFPLARALLGEAPAAGDELTGNEEEFYGDERVRGPVEFAAYYFDLLDRGVMAHLEVVSPRQARRLERRFEQDAARVGVGASAVESARG